MTQQEWIRIGVEAGYCTPPFCAMHEGPPESSWDREELAELEDGGDPCWHAVRLLLG